MTVATDVARFTARAWPESPHVAFVACCSPIPFQVGQFRCLSDTFLRLCGVAGPVCESVVLCVSELVTNGITHGAGDVSLLTCYCDNEIRVAVTDGSSTPPTLRTTHADETSGRGLLLVEALSQAWGVSEDGRTTWCTFRNPAVGS
ncbi:MULTISPECIES: ATP-binding protein [unclassified Streptomyces]|uniref:ATP-binding protein n=1 Tax=unclassified Streptomyces TaxID=2593676 RepID=UPI00332F606E